MCTYCETFNSPAYNHRYNCSPDMVKDRLKGLHGDDLEFYCTQAISRDCGRSGPW